MDNTEKLFQAAADRAGTMSKLAVFSGVVSALFALVSLICGTIWDEIAGSDIFSLGFPVYLIAFIFSMSALIYAALSRAANQEEVDKLQLEKRKASHHAFDVSEDVRFTAGRSFANYKKYAPYVVTLLGAALLLVLLSSYAAYWESADRIRAASDNNLRSLIIAILMMALSGFTGAFYIGQARAASFRWLRAVGGWFIVGFLLMLGAAVELCLAHFGIRGAESVIAWIGWGLVLVLAFELGIGFIVDFYRPRTVEEARPMFESSLLSLFTEPGGVMRNIADTLDYQFGFKVSGTYIYGFIERALFPALAVWLVFLWLFSAVDQVGDGEVGLRVRCGKLVSSEPLSPGLYFKLPWPFETINRYNCNIIREIVVGNDHTAGHIHAADEPEVDDGHGHSHGPDKAALAAAEAEAEARTRHLMFWDNHEGEETSSYMVAVAGAGTQSRAASGELPVNIALLNVTFPVQYRIREDHLLDYVYHNIDPSAMLKLLGEDVATEYLASAKLEGVMATDRNKVTAAMKSGIQALADELDLGVDIVDVAMIDVHPAPAVVEAYRNVLNAQEEMRGAVLSATIDEIRIVPAAEAYANEIVAAAESYSGGQRRIAEADANRFGKQLEAYSALPSLFRLRSYLDVLENETVNVRKYIISEELRREVYELNFEESVNFNFSDMELGKQQ